VPSKLPWTRAERSPARIKDVAYFVCADKLVFAVDNAGARHLLDVSLADLEAELDA
jgi:DNA-binding LytR/AlgR family response regulator